MYHIQKPKSTLTVYRPQPGYRGPAHCREPRRGYTWVCPFWAWCHLEREFGEAVACEERAGRELLIVNGELLIVNCEVGSE